MYHTEAIILKKDTWNEADLMVTALTERFGKIRLRAQGARKHGAKLKGHLEPLSRSHLTFVSGHNGYRLIGAELKDFFPNVRADLSALAAANIMAETLERNLFEERDGARGFWGLLAEHLRSLDALAVDNPSPEAINQALYSFHTRFLELSGLLAVGDGQREPALLYERARSSIMPPRTIFVPNFLSSARSQSVWFGK